MKYIKSLSGQSANASVPNITPPDGGLPLSTVVELVSHVDCQVESYKESAIHPLIQRLSTAERRGIGLPLAPCPPLEPHLQPTHL